MQTKSFTMEFSCKPHVLLVIILVLPVASSVARPFNRIVPLPTSSDHEPAPALNLALPHQGDAIGVFMIPACRMTEFSKTVSSKEVGLRSSSGSMASGHSRRRGRSRKFGPMYLNFLPKGSMPSSGPSRGTDSLHN